MAAVFITLQIVKSHSEKFFEVSTSTIPSVKIRGNTLCFWIFWLLLLDFQQKVSTHTSTWSFRSSSPASFLGSSEPLGSVFVVKLPAVKSHLKRLRLEAAFCWRHVLLFRGYLNEYGGRSQGHFFPQWGSVTSCPQISHLRAVSVGSLC